MSVDSGLPDYRGNEGLWNHYPIYRELGVNYEAMTRPSGFERDPSFAWGFYGHLLDLYRNTEPHAGYAILLDLVQRFGDRAFVLTTNIDGHFVKTGFHEQSVRECHGSIHRLQCLTPCSRVVRAATSYSPQVDRQTMRHLAPLPRCPSCMGIARPAVFAFGDSRYVWESCDHQASNYQAWKERTNGRRLVVIECGSGPTVPGLRREGEALARERQGSLIRINLRDWEITHADDVGLAGRAIDILNAIHSTL